MIGCVFSGVYLSKHADFLTANGFSKGYRGSLVVFKILKVIVWLSDFSSTVKYSIMKCACIY